MPLFAASLAAQKTSFKWGSFTKLVFMDGIESHILKTTKYHWTSFVWCSSERTIWCFQFLTLLGCQWKFNTFRTQLMNKNSLKGYLFEFYYTRKFETIVSWKSSKYVKETKSWEKIRMFGYQELIKWNKEFTTKKWGCTEGYSGIWIFRSILRISW